MTGIKIKEQNKEEIQLQVKSKIKLVEKYEVKRRNKKTGK